MHAKDLCFTGSHAPGYLDSRVEAFLNSYLPELENMSEGEFDEHREALIDAKLQKDHNLEEQADRHWDAVLNRRWASLNVQNYIPN